MQRGLAVKFTKALRTPQFLAGTGMRGIKKRAPCRRIFLVKKLRYRKLVEVRITEKFSTIIKRAAESFRRQMDGIGRAAAEACEIVAFQNVERFQHCDTAGAGRRCADDLVSAICSLHRL